MPIFIRKLIIFSNLKSIKSLELCPSYQQNGFLKVCKMAKLLKIHVKKS